MKEMKETKEYKKIKEFEQRTGASVIYITVTGSKLYGTDNELSDTDYKFLFIPSKESVLLKRDIDSINLGNQSKDKNTSEDVDIQGHSLYAFFDQLAKSETGAIDVLFSMFKEDTIMMQDKAIIDKIRKEYKVFLNKNMKSFIGYALSQTKRFGIKGARYDELDKFVKLLEQFKKDEDIVNVQDKLGKSFDAFRIILKAGNYKYIKFVMAPGSRVKGGAADDVEYISVLGKLFSATVTFEYFMTRVGTLYNQFGNRTKTVAETESKTDFKALSHSLRIADEVKELLETEFIKFPLKNAAYIREIKEGKHETQKVIDEISDVLDKVDILLLSSKLPEETDREKLNKFLLTVLTYKWNKRRNS